MLTDQTHSTTRSRIQSAGITLIVGAIGLASRHYAPELPPFLRKNPGDVLWALMIYLLVAMARPALATTTVAIIAGVIATAVEFAKFYHQPTLDAFRRTPAGHLLLGQGFSWTNLACYGLGIFLGLAVDLFLRKLSRR